MDKEKLLALLRNPKKYRKAAENARQAQPSADQKRQPDRVISLAAGAVFALVLVTILFIFSAQKKADNITSSLDPSVLKGLVVDATFNPGQGRRVVQISEGQDRNVNVRELGSTLPVISRYNYNALTPRNYQIIGEAPFALSINVSSNLDDPDLLRYLFNQDTTVQAFLKRQDVAPLLASPEALAAAVGDQEKLKAFFDSDAVSKALASPEVVRALAGSRLFSYLLISKSVKYYRDNPSEAARIINASPALSELKKNPAVRRAIQENSYLKNISATLLK